VPRDRNNVAPVQAHGRAHTRMSAPDSHATHHFSVVRDRSCLDRASDGTDLPRQSLVPPVLRVRRLIMVRGQSDSLGGGRSRLIGLAGDLQTYDLPRDGSIQHGKQAYIDSPVLFGNVM